MRQSVRFRAASAAASQPVPAPVEVTPLAGRSPVSFASDIAPIFKQFQGPMMWRLDLTAYDAVKANARTVYDQISRRQMPPPPFPPLSDTQIATFEAWMRGGCLP